MFEIKVPSLVYSKHSCQGILRKQAKQVLCSFSKDKVRQSSEIIFSKIMILPETLEALHIGLYASIDHEVCTFNWMKILLQKNKQIYLPCIYNNDLIFRKILSLNDLIEGKWGILEPRKDCPIIAPHNLDLLILPALLVDQQGFRIGRGGGFYDRFLNKHAIACTLCPVYEEQIISSSLPRPLDCSVDLIITDKRVVRTLFHVTKMLNGVKVSRSILQSLKKRVSFYNDKIILAIILIGDSSASLAYVNKKIKACEYIGIQGKLFHFLACISRDHIINLIKVLNNDSMVYGIIIQLPLPPHFDSQTILNTVRADKDVDGLTDENERNFFLLKRNFLWCTPIGIIRLLKTYNIVLDNKKIVLVGYGTLVGKPLFHILQQRGHNVVFCDSSTQNLSRKTKQADILVSATGVPGLITKYHVKKGVVVIDAGFSKVDNACVGDVRYDEVFCRVAHITPTPGGVGPMTVTMLLENVLQAYERSFEKQAKNFVSS